MSIKSKLLLLGTLLVLASFSSGASLKTHEYILLQRQSRSSSDAGVDSSTNGLDDIFPSSSPRFPEREYSFDPRPNIDPGELIPNYKDANNNDAISERYPPMSDNQPQDIEIVTGIPFDFMHSEDVGVLSGKQFHKIYSALDSIAQFMPIETTHDNLENKSNISSESHNVTAPSNENYTRADIDTDSYQTTLKIDTLEDVITANANDSIFNVSSPADKVSDLEFKDEARAIVRVSQLSGSGVSYIIHPDNLPAPTFKPMEGLPPSRPLSKWRADVFMKACCSETKKNDSNSDNLPEPIEVRTGYSQVGTVSSLLIDNDNDTKGFINELNTIKESVDSQETIDLDYEIINSTEIIQDLPVALPLITKPDNDSSGEPLNVTDVIFSNETALQPEVSSNHTPRYEESGSTYQDVTNFLRDIANSDGFKNAFIGDLIKNFGDLDQNAMKLIYSLLIRPLEGAPSSKVKSDRMGSALESTPSGPSHLAETEDFVVLGKDRLPLRDQPANGYHPFGIFPPSDHSVLSSRPQQIRPSSLVRQVSPASPEKDWRPLRTYPRLPSNGRRGDENIDVITAPPFKTFEVVLGSSLNHDESKPKPQNLPGNRWGAPQPTPPPSRDSHGLPFDKLQLGLEMPPQDALDALPPGSVLIPPAQILNQPNLPHIFTKKDGTPSLEIPLSELQPNLPFFGNEKPQRMKPPSKPEEQDIPPRIPSFLSSLFSFARPKPPQRNQTPRPIPQRPFIPPGPPKENRPIFPNRYRPTGPPPIVTKMTPPGLRINYPHEQVSQPIGIQADISNFNAQRPQMLETSNSFENPIQPPINGPMFGHAPSAVKPTSVNNPDPDIHIGQGISHNQYIPHPSTNQPQVLNFENETPPQAHNGDYYSEDHDYNENVQSHSFGDVEHGSPQESDIYYQDPPVDYIIDYYDYHNYYDDLFEGPEEHSDDTVESVFQSNDDPDSVAEMGQDNDLILATTISTLKEFNQLSFEDMLMGYKPDYNPATLSEQEKNDLQMLLQNHRMANAIAEANETVFNVLPNINPESLSPSLSNIEINIPPQFDSEIEDPDDDDHYMVPLTIAQGEVLQYSPPSSSIGPIADVELNEHDASVAHLWNNIQLIPLAADIFDTTEEENTMNLTALFDDAVPLSPDVTFNEIPDLGSDIDRITIDNSNGRVTITEEIDENGDARFMAYILIGACCGLALLSIIGVIVIVRFKKTCGSRQIRTRTRLTEQESIENISRHMENLTLGGESGHKLGSWFTGRNEHIGSGKLRSNMTLPTVHDLKKGKNSKSGSTRDLLSISSESSQASSPLQGHRGVEGTIRNDDEEPRTSWLHDEYRASLSDLSQAAGQDLTYIPRQYQQMVEREAPHQSLSHSEHQRFRDVSMDSEEVERSSRDRRYSGQQRMEPERSPSHRHPQFVSSMESEELEERLDRDNRYTTDSEVEDWTTNYEDESREPSRYLADSRELDDTVARRNDPNAVTSQELGDQLSRDLKEYQSRRVGRTDKVHRDSHHNVESSQEMDAENSSRELQRSQSQVSFSRDNVQNEVFLEFDNIFRQHGQYLNGEAPASTLGRISRATEDTQFSASRANTPDSIDLPEQHSHNDEPPPSPPTTPPRFSPPPPPPRPPKPGHLSQSRTPSPRSNRARPPSPSQSPPSLPRNQRSVYWTSEEERLI